LDTPRPRSNGNFRARWSYAGPTTALPFPFLFFFFFLLFMPTSNSHCEVLRGAPPTSFQGRKQKECWKEPCSEPSTTLSQVKGFPWFIYLAISKSRKNSMRKGKNADDPAPRMPPPPLDHPSPEGNLVGGGVLWGGTFPPTPASSIWRDPSSRTNFTVFLRPGPRSPKKNRRALTPSYPP